MSTRDTDGLETSGAPRLATQTAPRPIAIPIGLSMTGIVETTLVVFASMRESV
ncbi:MAG: hypothetical protein JOZ87_06700 [Chloroflexi bacterium]|nr:hypothetical protein [Chloroflexota bacterium]